MAYRRRHAVAAGVTVVAAIALMVTVAALVVGGVRTWGHATRFLAATQAAAAEAERAREQPMSALAALDTVQVHLADARSELEAMRPVADPLAHVAEWLTNRQVGGSLPAQIAGAWRFADAATALGEELAAAGRKGISSAHGGPPDIVAAQPEILLRLRAAQGHFDRAAAARSHVESPTWPLDRLAPTLSRWDAVAPRLTDGLTQAQRVVSALPAALGSDRPVTYLVLAQTSDDLRATGGFISSVGVIRIEGGRITSFDFEKVYAAEGIGVPGPDDTSAHSVAPPAPLGLYMGLGEWRLRDANWWADFPTTARQAARFWQSLGGPPVDGVIAFDEAALETTLEVVGGVTLEDGTLVTADTLRDVTLARVFQGDDPAQWYAAQSAFSRSLAQQLIAAAERLEPDRLVALGQALYSASLKRDLLVASFEPQVASLARTYGVDGALLGARTDYLYVVEQNVSYGKLSPFIRQSLDYTIDLDAEARPRHARLTLDMVNEYAVGRGRPGYPSHYYNGMRWNYEAGRMDIAEGYYGGYTRLYLPLGSRILGVSGFDGGVSIGTETGRTVIGGHVSLEMGARRRLQVEWEPASEAVDLGRYQLLIQRQPGAPTRDLTVRVRLPDGASVASVAPTDARIDATSVQWRGSPEHDLLLEMALYQEEARIPAMP